MHVLWSPQGKLQGVLEENQQLRDQLEQLRSHNASLALQLQEQYDESARCLADISSSLSTEANIDGRWTSLLVAIFCRLGVTLNICLILFLFRVSGVVSRRGPLAPRGSLEEDEKQPSLVTPPRGPGVHGHALHGHGRVSRASSCGSSSGGSSRGVVGRPPRLDQHHGVHLPYHRRQRAASPDAVAPGPWDYSDHADLCDSGFWSLQASPPRSSSVLAAALSPASAASHTAPSTPTPARLCWLGRSASPAAPETLISPPPGPGGTFILSTRRPRPSRH
ncbi:uncharacterized protein LOC113206851 isoform X2 [Frankliniella occidentalis]|uniref:Uncharacterized protein LOC113206851 isoform X2 n=1 Tax=Frankliniella occidentalis TaxID=133901 RepID=A0A9C6XB52_FRAOC|nr:uncharacterized protein LOC113206851 isoform X2 [Frankliniella occidentalis]